jgi:hypothetical protein
MGKVYNHSGMGNGVYVGIEADSVFKISGMGTVTINGTIGRRSYIQKSGMGNLFINGNVAEGVIFEISGMGNVVFRTRPPESVVSAIRKSGMGDITMPGGYESSQPSQSTRVHNVISSGGTVQLTMNGVTRTYRGNSVIVSNNRVTIDGVEVSDDDSRLVNSSTEQNPLFSWASLFSTLPNTSVISTSSVQNIQRTEPGPSRVTTPAVSSTDVNNSEDLSSYSQSLRNYLKTFENKKKISERIEELNLNTEEKELFTKYEDSITYGYMDRPVTLNERHFDITSIRGFNGEDPFSKVKFNPLEVQSARTLVELLDADIENLLTMRKKATQEQKVTAPNF